MTISLRISDQLTGKWQLKKTQNNPNIGFENFMLIINNLLNQKKEKLKLKPWITKGISSIKQSDKIYKKMIEAKNSQTK